MRQAVKSYLLKTILIALIVPMCFGCAKNKDLKLLSRQQAATIESLNTEIERLNQELESALSSQETLFAAKEVLEKQLADQLAAGNVELTMGKRGLVVTVLDRILFDSGKAELKSSAMETLGKVSDALKGELAANRIYVEGHTDNVPIKVSGWKSNWELSTARATEVVHYFIDEGGIAPARFAACGYSEYQPVELNDTREDRIKNRRVEIVISPQTSE